ncbi:MAG: ABC transporter ATP-binding protein [Elusimicrobia bacterium]|nr:ABC transporter ATP-binding protein [Elusimicrobiota bacterium]
MNTTILQAQRLYKTFNRTVKALDDVSIELSAGSVLGIVGESGSGKSTLARILCGMIACDTGTIEIDGKNIDAYPRKQLSEKVQMIFQDPFSSLNPKLTVGTQLREAAGYRADDAIGEILAKVELPPAIFASYPHQFSGGQRQRIAIARALLKHPAIIIADEPLSALDVTTQNQILKLFQSMKDEHQTTFIFISHDLAVTSALADNICIMKAGKIIESGTAEAIIYAPESPYTKELLAAVPTMSQ